MLLAFYACGNLLVATVWPASCHLSLKENSVAKGCNHVSLEFSSLHLCSLVLYAISPEERNLILRIY